MTFITGISHVNLSVPEGTLDQAKEFYGGTLVEILLSPPCSSPLILQPGFKDIPVPAAQRGTIAWFDVTPGGQQIHISFPKNGAPNEPDASRHPCFKLPSPEALLELRERIWQHYLLKSDSSPRNTDEPGKENSGAKGVEYPERFFARDYANNRLEFSL